MKIRTAYTGEEFIINCSEHHDRDELAVIWYELERKGVKIKGISSGVCFNCAKVLYSKDFTEQELIEIYKPNQ